MVSQPTDLLHLQAYMLSSIPETAVILLDSNTVVRFANGTLEDVLLTRVNLNEDQYPNFSEVVPGEFYNLLKEPVTSVISNEDEQPVTVRLSGLLYSTIKMYRPVNSGPPMAIITFQQPNPYFSTAEHIHQHFLRGIAGITSHDLKSPLKSIQVLLDLLVNTNDPTEQKKISSRMENMITSMLENLETLTDVLSADNNIHSIPVPVSFEEILHEHLENLHGQIISSGAKVNYDFSACREIYFPKPFIKSIMLNLLSNALKYHHAQRLPVISFRSSRKPGKVLLTVEDNGVGIDLHKYGNKLFGLHNTFHEHKDSRGIGLYLVKKQLELMGGSIEVDSEVGKGTTFTITFLFEKNQEG